MTELVRAIHRAIVHGGRQICTTQRMKWLNMQCCQRQGSEFCRDCGGCKLYLFLWKFAMCGDDSLTVAISSVKSSSNSELAPFPINGFVKQAGCWDTRTIQTPEVIPTDGQAGGQIGQAICGCANSFHQKITSWHMSCIAL